jgi:glucokinase
MTDKCFVGVDLGGTNIKAGCITADAEILSKISVPTEGERGQEHVIGRICGAVDSVLEGAGRPRDLVGGVGIGFPGTLDIKAGVVRYPANIPGCRNIPVVQRVRERTGFPVLLENDANAAAYAEYWVGAARDAGSMVMLTLGTGVGGGIVIDGKVLHGNTDCAGELGHMIIEVNGRKCGCGKWGCLEAYASATSLVKRFAEAVQAGHLTVLADHFKTGGKVSARDIYEAAIGGDEVSCRLFRETGSYLGMGIVNIMHTLNPARIVLSGGMIAAGDLLMRPIREMVEARALSDAQRNCEVIFAALGEDAGLLGAAGCALAEFGTSR